jgi:hypothetical protein
MLKDFIPYNQATDHKSPRKPSEIRKQLNDYMQSNQKAWVVAEEMLDVIYGSLFFIKNSSHVEWLVYTLKNLYKRYEHTGENEFPAMMYGMINEAIRLALLDLARFTKKNWPEVFKGFQTQEDAEFYFTVACESIFVRPDEWLHLMSVEDLGKMVGKIIMMPEVQQQVYFSDIDADMAAIILNLAEKDEFVQDALTTYKLRLRDKIYAYLKDFR